jgi:hypothetical protein
MIIVDEMMGWNFYREGINGCERLGLIGWKG